MRMQGRPRTYRVAHPAHGTVELEAVDMLQAVCGAAKKWGVPWTGIARECDIQRAVELPKGMSTGKKRGEEEEMK